MLKEKLKSSQLILASKSPRRRELLSLLDIDFDSVSLLVDESYPENLKGKEITEHICKQKAKAFVFSNNKDIVLTADTLVMLGDEVLGKPHSAKEAKEMLFLLSGKKHNVISSYCIANQSKSILKSDTAKVYVKNLSEEEINYYVEKNQPFDKAGAYGIQEWFGAIAIEKIEGSFYTIMGLPLHSLHIELMKF